MTAVFSGDWTVVGAISGDVVFDHLYRFVIAGSLSSDGVYPVSLTTPPVAVSGPRWTVSLEYFELHANLIGTPETELEPNRWVAFDVRRTSAGYTLQSGLVVFVGKDVHNQFLICRNVEPRITPWRPFTNPYDFTLPRRRDRIRPVQPLRRPD